MKLKKLSRDATCVCVAGRNCGGRHGHLEFRLKIPTARIPGFVLGERKDKIAMKLFGGMTPHLSKLHLGDCSRSEHLHTPPNYLCLKINLLINVINSQCELILPMNDIQKSETWHDRKSCVCWHLVETNTARARLVIPGWHFHPLVSLYRKLLLKRERRDPSRAISWSVPVGFCSTPADYKIDSPFRRRWPNEGQLRK